MSNHFESIGLRFADKDELSSWLASLGGKAKEDVPGQPPDRLRYACQ